MFTNSGHKLSINKKANTKSTGFSDRYKIETGGFEPPTLATSRQCSPAELRFYKVEKIITTKRVIIKNYFAYISHLV